MKKIRTADIASGKGMRVKKGTLDHLQEAYIEAIFAMARQIIGEGYDAAKVYRLFGCLNSTPGGSTFTVSAGALFYNGEVFFVDATTFTAGGGETAVLSITTTNYTASIADPVTFSDGSNYNVHEIRKLTIASAVSGSGIKDFNDVVVYPMQENFEDISSTVTANANLTVIQKKVRRYPDGTVEIVLSATVVTTIAANTKVLDVIPAGNAIGAVFTAHAVSGGGTPGTIPLVLYQTDIRTPIFSNISSASWATIFIHLLYKVVP